MRPKYAQVGRFWENWGVFKRMSIKAMIGIYQVVKNYHNSQLKTSIKEKTIPFTLSFIGNEGVFDSL